MKKRAKAWAAANPERAEARRTAIRHTRRAAEGAPLSRALAERILNRRVCNYCGVGIDRKAPMYHPCKATIDHVVPLTRGGTNAESNLVAACFGCNIRKRAMPVDVFLSRMARGLA
jgi:5-methylcytosine-specific restriction endonuclease McrA